LNNIDKAKILIVDDRPENIIALSNLIFSVDIEILTALNASDALELLLQHEFALAILDVQMPDIDGFELAGIMRSAERSKSIPIIFVTASQGAERHIFTGYEHGAVDFLLKPLNPHIVRSKVNIFVDLYQKKQLLKQRSIDLEDKLQEVQRLHEAAESANRAKGRFVANMSHEIRTPLGAMLGYAELLKIEDLSREERETHLGSILRNGKLLLQIIDDVLDLAKIEAEKIKIDIQKSALEDILTDVKAIHQNRASEKGISFVVSAQGKIPTEFETDPLRLKQILNNLVGNAIKFTDQGKVELAIQFEQTHSNNHLKFIITDSGCGMTATQSARLFQPFVQADSSTTRRFGGTGLGLVISKHLANLLQGDVVLKHSAPGEGSTFILSLNLQDKNFKLENSKKVISSLDYHKPIAQSQRPRIDGVRVLVVDDATDNRVLIDRILNNAGAIVDQAKDGSEGVQKASNHKYDLILMDIQMPVMDGYEATQVLRERGLKIPIIALTAHAMKDEVQRCIMAGCTEHFSKPINHLALLKKIQELTANT
jgi:signal transduction histidine kinase